MKRTGFKRSQKLTLKRSVFSKTHRTPLKSVGRVGRANLASREIIAQTCEEKNITHCEIGLTGCMGTFGIAPAHRHPRTWYRGTVELLASFVQWVAACQYCHDKIDTNNKLKDEVFMRLRGKE